MEIEISSLGEGERGGGRHVMNGQKFCLYIRCDVIFYLW